MEMYSKIDKMTMTELKENLNRIEKIISNINFTSSLKDKGEKMKLTKVKLEKEIHLRETLQQAEEKVANLSLTNNSEVIVHNTQYTQKLCKVEKEPKMLRFIPALTPNVSAQLHSTKPINLPESLKLQSDQSERVKAEQVRSKHLRLISLEAEETDEDISDSNDQAKLNDSE